MLYEHEEERPVWDKVYKEEISGILRESRSNGDIEAVQYLIDNHLVSKRRGLLYRNGAEEIRRNKKRLQQVRRVLAVVILPVASFGIARGVNDFHSAINSSQPVYDSIPSHPLSVDNQLEYFKINRKLLPSSTIFPVLPK